MSNASLQLRIGSAASIADVEGILGVNLSHAGLGPPDSQLQPGLLGFIRVYYRDNPGVKYKPFDRDWKWRLIFEAPYRWEEVRLALVMNLCSWLVDEFPGDYLAESGAGSVLFFGNHKGWTVNEPERVYFEASQAFKGRSQFMSLPPS
jgi:hypothetical protein